MSDAWIGLVTEKAPVYTKGAIDLTVRNRLELALLQRHGNIKLNHDTSYEEFYTVDYAEPPVTGFGDGARAVFSRRNYLKTATKNSRGHYTSDEMHIKEKALLGHNTTNIVNRYNKIIPKLIDAVKKTIGLEMYVDGSAAGNEYAFEGFETFTGTYTEPSDEGDKIAMPTATYNNLSCALASAGSWSTDFPAAQYPHATLATDWPEGKGDPQYDYWSPKLVHYPSTAWGTSFVTWKANAEQAVRTTGSWLHMTAGINRASLVSLMASHMLDEFKNAQSAKGQSLLPHPEARDLGFPAVLNFDGIALQATFGIPVNSCYIFDVTKAQLEFLEDEMIKVDGPNWDTNSQSFKFTARSFGNYVWLPKHVAKIGDFTA